MPLAIRLRVVLGVGLSLSYGTLAAASYTVQSWTLFSETHDSASGMNNIVFFLDVLNPFQNSHMAAIGTPPSQSTASAAYDFAWDPATGGSFSTTAAHTVLDGPVLSFIFSRTIGTLWISTTQDILLTTQGTYDVNLPAFDFSAGIQLTATRLDPFEILLAVGDGANSFGGAVSRQLSLSGSTVLEAGDTYLIQYQLRVDSFGGNTGQFGVGSGFLDFQLQVVPEPTAFGLALTSACAVFMRRRARAR